MKALKYAYCVFKVLPGRKEEDTESGQMITKNYSIGELACEQAAERRETGGFLFLLRISNQCRD